MDTILCDELLQEIFRRLPPSSSSAVSLVSKRWLRLFRSSRTCLSLRLSPHCHSSLPSFLSCFPFLSSLSLAFSAPASSSFADRFLISAASSCPNLRHLRLLAGPVSLFPLLSLSSSCPRLCSLSIAFSRPLSFHWLLHFRSLKDLSVVASSAAGQFDSVQFHSSCQQADAELQLENLALSAIRHGDCGLDWLWRSCKKLKKLQLRSCEAISTRFVECLKSLQEVELRTCRAIVDVILSNLAEDCSSLKSLLVYDGGSKSGLLRFLNRSRCNFQKLDLRLPLDLNNDHLLAVAENFRGLSSLRLQSCCLVTAEGLRTIGIAMGDELEELALINCDVMARNPGLLTALGQNLRRLKKLDLSYNETLMDIEFTSMLASCNSLRELKLRGCKGLTNATIVSMSKTCKHLESVDMLDCCGIEAEAVELFLLNSPRLSRVQVEESKVSDAARSWALNKFIEIAV
ncbi:EIN3-binding F-box protein 1-like [Diospyros lotus]|uniref:EIN3-binding F-box protein 1-like n=1 Tax=Diospyros lotus TaxID=55363 RepID=UPI002259B4BC|nr:EIN3-binding F-box protein 1-like [Diospyros lotus]